MNKTCKFFAILAFYSINANAQTTVTRAITDFKGYWSSEAGALNPTQPDTSHMLLGFKYGSTIYSTGVADSILTLNNVPFQAQKFEAFQLASNTINTNSATVIGVGYKYGGNGNVDPMPVNSNLAGYLSDGAHGLDLGTAIFNAAPNSLLYYINATNDSAIGDSKPDILVTQVGEPPASTTLDSFRFIDINGLTVGHSVAISVSGLTIIGNGSWKFYNTDTPMTYNSGLLGSRPLRMIAFDFADFGITTANIGTVRNFVHRLSGQSDQAFVAYNTASFSPGTGVTLPVKLTAFNASRSGNNAVLRWKIAAADNFSKFVVERNAGNDKFIAIDEVGLKANINDYQFIDQEPMPGTNLYRLRLVDNDGKSEYSAVEKLDFSAQQMISAFPNPCTDFVTLTSVLSDDIIAVTNANGVSVTVRRTDVSTIDMSELPDGIYTVSVYRNKQRIYASFVVKQ